MRMTGIAPSPEDTAATDPGDVTRDWEVFAVRYGTRMASRSSVFLHYEVYGEPDAPLGMDYYFWLIRSGDELVMVDTGFGELPGARRGRTMLIQPTQALNLFGVQAEEVPLIVATHAHYDHIGNLGDFPKARVVMSRREYDFWTGANGNRPLFMSSAETSEIDSLRRRQIQGTLTLIGADTEIRPGIRVTEVGGHTPGQLIVAVDTRGGRVILASDAAHYFEEVECDRPFAHVVDLQEMFDAFTYLRQLVDREGHVLVPGHDPLVMSKFERCGGVLSGHAVKIA